MKTLPVSVTLILFVVCAALTSAQTPEQMVSPANPVRPTVTLRAPTSRNHSTALKPVARDLRLRGGAVPTGLTGFYDYQSNGGSPGYIAVQRGTPEYIVTTYMSSPDGS